MKTGIVGRFVAPVVISAAALGAASQAKADTSKADAIESVMASDPKETGQDVRVLAKVSGVETDDQKTKNNYNPMFPDPMFPIYLFALGGTITSLVILVRTSFNMEDRATW